MMFYTDLVVGGSKQGSSLRRLIFAEAGTEDSQWGVMVYVRPGIEAGTIQDQADVPPPQLPPDQADETDEEPDVEDIEVDCQVKLTD